MTITDRIRDLCAKKGISMTILEKELGFGNGSLTKNDGNTMRIDRLMLIAEYFDVTIEYLSTGNLSTHDFKSQEKTYYTDPDTSQVAQDLFENKDLRLLFDAARDASAEDLQTVHQMLLALKAKENK